MAEKETPQTQKPGMIQIPDFVPKVEGYTPPSREVVPLPDGVVPAHAINHPNETAELKGARAAYTDSLKVGDAAIPEAAQLAAQFVEAAPEALSMREREEDIRDLGEEAVEEVVLLDDVSEIDEATQERGGRDSKHIASLKTFERETPETTHEDFVKPLFGTLYGNRRVEIIGRDVAADGNFLIVREIDAVDGENGYRPIPEQDIVIDTSEEQDQSSGYDHLFNTQPGDLSDVEAAAVSSVEAAAVRPRLTADELLQKARELDQRKATEAQVYKRPEMS